MRLGTPTAPSATSLRASWSASSSAPSPTTSRTEPVRIGAAPVVRGLVALVLAIALALGEGVGPASAAPPEQVPVADRPVGRDAALPPPSTAGVAAVGADRVWERGHTGHGVGVALVDTGISPAADLGKDSPTQVDLVPAGRGDGTGHGTFLAGLIAGHEGPDGPIGAAPSASLWSVKVADGDGATSLETVVEGLELVRARADELGIRVVVLALSGPALASPDPIEAALEQLWADGLVVIVAAGNDHVLEAPGVSPYLITVGAMDDVGTAAVGDDRLLPWSAVGEGRDGRPKPDVLAPGASVVSLRAPGSVADRENPASRIGGRWFRGTGTSMAAATTAGAAALLLDAEPHLAPDDVKGRLIAAARPITGSSAGVLDVDEALTSTAPPANTHLADLDGAQGPLGDTAGEWVGRSWIGRSWVEQEWVGRSWVGRSWVGRSWVGRSWVGRSWVGRSWI